MVYLPYPHKTRIFDTSYPHFTKNYTRIIPVFWLNLTPAADVATLLHPFPCSLHPSPFTLLPSPFSLHLSPFSLLPAPCPRLAQQSWMDDLRPPKAQSQSLVTSVFGGTLQVGIQFLPDRKSDSPPAEWRDVSHLQDFQQEARPLPGPVYRYTPGQIRMEGIALLNWL